LDVGLAFLFSVGLGGVGFDCGSVDVLGQECFDVHWAVGQRISFEQGTEINAGLDPCISASSSSK